MADLQPVLIDPEAVSDLIRALRSRGFACSGRPFATARSSTTIDGADDCRRLDRRQDGGTYRLERRDDEALFGYAVGPHSWKQFLLPAACGCGVRDGTATRRSRSRRSPPPSTPLALLGVRSCELHAIEIQDRVFLGGRYVDRDYAARREDAFIVAVNCAEPGGTCFCVSMGTGPRAEAGYDLALTEILEASTGSSSRSGPSAAQRCSRSSPSRPAARPTSERPRAAWTARPSRWAAHMDTDGLATCSPATSSTRAGTTSPRAAWRAATARWSARPASAPRSRTRPTSRASTPSAGARWDSCFTLDHSYIHGGSVRPSGRSRYRQWMTHKLATWNDQFGTSGCVGCGRCITWCPVGIDITEEVAAIRGDGWGDAMRDA